MSKCNYCPGTGLRSHLYSAVTDGVGTVEIGILRGWYIFEETVSMFLDPVNDPLHASDDQIRVLSDGGLPAQHEGICPIEHCVRHIGSLRPCRED